MLVSFGISLGLTYVVFFEILGKEEVQAMGIWAYFAMIFVWLVGMKISFVLFRLEKLKDNY